MRSINLRRVFVFSICIALFTNSLSARTLPVRLHRQHTLVWCWAASIAMVVEYLTGNPIEDCEVLSRYDAALGGPGTCCVGDNRCMRGGMPGEIAPIIRNLYGVQVSALERALSWSEIVGEIDNSRPVIAWVWNSPTSAHVVVIVGYEDSGQLIVDDPLRGQLALPYSGFATNWGPSHLWNLSWRFQGTGSGPSTEQWTTIVEPCTHPAHPAGDRMACVHGTMHAYDTTACMHVCYMYGRAVPCHPYDTWPCVHPVHPGGDIVACTHPAHPEGHARRVRVR
jgi:hypothetical protein